MEFRFVGGNLQFTHEKAPVIFGDTVKVDGYDISFPGEYEKSGMIAEVREYGDSMVYRFTVGGRTLFHLPESTESLTSDMTQFAGDVDILMVPGKKELQKVVESIDARVVIPYGSSKSALLGAFGQSIETEEKRVLKAADFDDEHTLFVDLAE